MTKRYCLFRVTNNSKNLSKLDNLASKKDFGICTNTIRVDSENLVTISFSNRKFRLVRLRISMLNLNKLKFKMQDSFNKDHFRV